MKRTLIIGLVLSILLVACGSPQQATELEPSTGGDSEIVAVEEPTEEIKPEPTELPTEIPTEIPVEVVEPEEPEVEDPVSTSPLAEALQAIVDKQANENGFPGVILHVSAPDLDFTWQGAAGMSDPENDLALIPDDQFAIASVTKMYTAAVVAMLVEQGNLDLDDPISMYLDGNLVAQVHVFDGESYGEQLTIRHLLNHTSGFAGFSDSVDKDENGIPDMKDRVQAEPEKIWTTDEVLAFAIEASPPLFAPGAAMAYSDLNYQLLGVIVENITGMTLDQLYRQWIFEPLGMEHAYLEFREDPVPGVDGRSMAHLYYKDWDWTDNKGRSYDWGAGGIVATAAEQAAFTSSVFDGSLFADPATAEMMFDWVETGFPGWGYGMGIFNIDLESMESPGLGHLQGHIGTWNNFAYYVPEMNIVLVGTLSSSEPGFGHLGMVIEALYTIQAMSQ